MASEFSDEIKTQARSLLTVQPFAGIVAAIGGPDRLNALMKEMEIDGKVLALITAAAAAVTSIQIDHVALDSLFDGSASRDAAPNIGEALEAALSTGQLANIGPLLAAYAAASGIRKQPLGSPAEMAGAASESATHADMDREFKAKFRGLPGSSTRKP